MWSAASQLRISPSKPDDHDEELRRLSRVTGGSRATLRLDVAAFVRAQLARNSQQTLVAVCHWPGVAIKAQLSTPAVRGAAESGSQTWWAGCGPATDGDGGTQWELGGSLATRRHAALWVRPHRPGVAGDVPGEYQDSQHGHCKKAVTRNVEMMR